MQIMAGAAWVVLATSAGVSRADDLATTYFENTLDIPITLDLIDSNSPDKAMRHIGLNRPMIDGKPSLMAYSTTFKASKDKNGKVNLAVTVHCGSMTDSNTYARLPAKTLITVGCRLTR
jgi:hypothetical protein